MVLEEILNELKKTKAKRVLIHFPAGLANLALEVEKKKPKGKQVFFWSEECFGACDVPHLQAKFFNCQKIISVGHLPMKHWNKLKVPVVFIPYYKGDPNKLKVPEIPGKKIVVVASNQFIHFIPEVKKQLKKMGKIPLIGKPGVMCSVPGQITGCDYVSAKQFENRADAVLFITEGKFHPIKLKIPSYQLDPQEGTLKKILPEKNKRINFLYFYSVFGVLVSSKPGQERLKTALILKRKLEERGKTVIILLGDTFSPSIRNFSGVECLITTACPRISGDLELYGLPILTAEEVLSAI